LRPAIGEKLIGIDQEPANPPFNEAREHRIELSSKR
jgi:hypothetical protein